MYIERGHLASRWSRQYGMDQQVNCIVEQLPSALPPSGPLRTKPWLPHLTTVGRFRLTQNKNITCQSNRTFSMKYMLDKPGVKVGLTKETGIPAPDAPSKAMGNSGTLGETIAITSFFRNPARVKALAKRRMSCLVMSYVYFRPVIPHS